MKTIELDESRLPAILDAIPDGRPVVMLNLLKFNHLANYSAESDDENCPGREAYDERYLKPAKSHISAIGGTVIYDGDVCTEVIGEKASYWNRIIIVSYPSITEFMAMVSSPEYQAIRLHRAAALEDSRLVATIENA